MNTIEVCLTPDLIHQHSLEDKVVIVVDIFRATSCIVTGLAFGVRSITPVMEVEECLDLGKKGMIMAGERGGQKIEGFEIGNSPFEYRNESFIGRDVAITTTNGTRAIALSAAGDEILVGSFLNITATARYLERRQRSLIVHCAGWKGTPNIEDTLYAGALIDRLNAVVTGDSAEMAHQLYLSNRKNLLDIAKKSGHAERLKGFGVEKDIEFCVTNDIFPDTVVGLNSKKLVLI